MCYVSTLMVKRIQKTTLQQDLISVCILMDTEMFKVSISVQVMDKLSLLSTDHGRTMKLLL